MSTFQVEEQAKPGQTQSRFPVLAAAMLGSILGGLGCIQAYHSLLGGAEQQERLAQIEKTVEHSRQVSEQALALLTKIEGESAERVAQSNRALSKNPTQQELSEAIDGLLSDGSEKDYERLAMDAKITKTKSGDLSLDRRALQAVAELYKADQAKEMTKASADSIALSYSAKQALAQVARVDAITPASAEMDDSLKKALDQVAQSAQANSPQAMVKADSDKRLIARAKPEGNAEHAAAAPKGTADK